ncbi:MAG: mechanosensitive ion channel family protein [Acidobacteriota bacterium]|nr:mechanosensitive ion channel family protein [Acidobacteriota bacterium]
MNWQEFLNYLSTAGLNIGLKILGALVVLFVGRWVIRFVVRLVRKALEIQVPEPTLNSYIGTLISVLLHIALIVSIMGFFGFETTTFAALLAGVGVAIGAAWSGLLSNFAAGVFLVVLRPFKLGDTITAGGVTGVVKEIGMFVTRIDTGDHVVNFVGNNKIFSDNIQNFTQNEYRRIDARLTLTPERNPLEIMRKIEANLAKMPNVLKTPAPEIGILEVTREGTTVTVRPFAENKNYQKVLYETNRMIVELLAEK